MNQELTQQQYFDGEMHGNPFLRDYYNPHITLGKSNKKIYTDSIHLSENLKKIEINEIIIGESGPLGTITNIVKTMTLKKEA